MNIRQFYEFIRWETEEDNHHVFPERFISGAYSKKGLSQKKASEKFRINLREIKPVSMSAHCFYNDLFDNNSPPEILKKISLIINSEYVYRREKKLFIKFCLCALKEKLIVTGQKEKFEELGKIVKSFDIDLNNGNIVKIKQIINNLGLTQANIEFYLERNFFPENWKYLNEEMWSCYINRSSSFFTP